MSTSVPLELIIVAPMPPAPTRSGASRVLATQASAAMELPVQVTILPLFSIIVSSKSCIFIKYKLIFINFNYILHISRQ